MRALDSTISADLAIRVVEEWSSWVGRVGGYQKPRRRVKRHERIGQELQEQLLERRSTVFFSRMDMPAKDPGPLTQLLPAPPITSVSGISPSTK
ncbi:hypothetical protein ANO14919_125390 [Xylariales sp. No.14919]|nr:hypothetical protein ANO14919_125390 [Xylariales sp. No.14919]